MYAKTERNKVPRGENVHQSMESMKEKAPEEAERGSALRMSSSSKKVARRPGAERMCPSEYMGSLSIRA
jgi:hypothetical protein